MNIQLIKEIERLQPTRLIKISQALQLDMITTLNLIANINNHDDKLIIENAGYYSLSRPINWINYAKVKELLTTYNLPHQFILFEQINSTNSYALNNIANFNTFPLFINGELQINGRGRFGKVWTSKIAHDITCTIVYQFPLEFNLTIMPILVAVAVNRLLKNYSVRNKIKWPNDIYIDKQKACGILVENVLRNQINHCVIGIGLNNIDNWERNNLLVNLINEVHKIISEYTIFGFPFLQREWLDNCIHYKQKVSLVKDNVTITSGIHRGLSEFGELIVSTNEGTQKFNTSALSLRFHE